MMHLHLAHPEMLPLWLFLVFLLVIVPYVFGVLVPRMEARGRAELLALRADRQLTRNSDIPCPACAAPCPECGGEGQHPCYAFGCMGGILIHAEEICTRLPVSEPHPEICDCRGTKRIVTQSQPCPVCQGTRIEPCAVCRASGQLSSGRDNLAYAAGYLSRAHAMVAGGMVLTVSGPISVST